MKEQILNKATDLFLNYGFKSVTMDDIAHRMGISKKTIYAHYKNKSRLVEACTLYVFQTISRGIDRICALEKNPIEELYEIKKFVMEHLKDEKSSPLYQLNKYYPRIYATLHRMQFEEMHRCVLENVKKGIGQGYYRTNLNAEFVSRIYFTGVIGIRDNNLFPESHFTKPQLADEYLEYHLRGIVTPLGRKELKKIINSNSE